MVLVLTYTIAALILGLYIGWFAYRYRRDQRNKAAEAETLRSRMPPLSATPFSRDEPSTSPPAATTTVTDPATPPASGSPPTDPGGARTVAAALSGIAMPHDLVPLTSMGLRPSVVDQVAFSSRMPVDVVAPAFADELERLGYAVTPLDQGSLAAKRGNDNLIVYVHPGPAAAAPDGTVVIEVCVPF